MPAASAVKLKPPVTGTGVEKPDVRTMREPVTVISSTCCWSLVAGSCAYARPPNDTPNALIKKAAAMCVTAENDLFCEMARMTLPPLLLYEYNAQQNPG